MAWQQITFKTVSEKAEKLSDDLWELGALSVSFVDDEDEPIFEPELNKTVLWSHTNVVSLFAEDAEPQLIIAALEEFFGYKDLNYQAEFIPDQDWERKWMDDYKPMQFGDKLWICPTEMSVDAEDAVVVSLDPGLAFGTGTHPTTRMCLQWLDQQAQLGNLKGKTVIDYGCGSGVLAIAALLLGAEKAYCVDIDIQAIEATKYNAVNNNVADKVEALLVENFPKDQQADIVLANILAGPLVELAPTLASHTKNGGRLALSGILDIKEKDILNAYSGNFEFEPVKHDEEWLAFSGVKKA